MIYRLDDQIALALSTAYDPETGELKEGVTEEALFAEIERLKEDFDVKIDSILSDVKNEEAEAAAIATEIEKLKDRKDKAERRADRAKRLAAYLLNGEKWKNGRHAVTYRTSTSVQCDDDFITWAKEHAPGYLSFKPAPEPTADKKAIGAALKAGEIIEHAQLVQKNNIQVK